MVDVYIVTLSLLAILISLPALLVGLNLILPNVTGRVETRLAETPGRSFVLGIMITAAFLLFIAIASQVNFGPVRGLAFVAAVLGMGMGAIGAAGMARHLGTRLAPMSRPTSKLGNLVRGSMVYELACLVPIVGWFLFLPLAGVMVMGAASFALLGWLPRPRVVISSQSSPVAPA